VLAYSGTAQFFGVPPIISGMDKATDFKFCTHISRVNQNKSPRIILGKVAVGIVRESRKFSGTHIWGALHGHLCDSTAFLLLLDDASVTGIHILFLFDRIIK